MEIDVIVLAGGGVDILVNGVSFERADEETRRLIAELRATLGEEFRQVGATEQHREGGVPHAHVVGQRHAHGR